MISIRYTIYQKTDVLPVIKEQIHTGMTVEDAREQLRIMGDIVVGNKQRIANDTTGQFGNILYW